MKENVNKKLDKWLNADIELPKYKREYCCCECGLIWFAETTTVNTTICPECKSADKKMGGIYACDSMAYAYAFGDIKKSLSERKKEIHYHKDHPKYQKEQCVCWSEYGESLNSGIKCSNCGREL